VLVGFTEVAEGEVVEQYPPVVDRPHVNGVIEEPEPGAKVFERVVVVQVPANHAVPVSEFDALLNVVVSRAFPR
jgi:hypothetical protein